MTQKTVVFDFGGVLFRTSATEFYSEVFERNGHTTESLQYFLNTVFTNQDRSQSNRGNAQDIIDQKSRQYPEWHQEIEAFSAEKEFIKTVRGVVPGMNALLKEIVQEGHRIVGLTNWHGDTFDTLPQAFPEIIKYFDQIIVSGKVGLRKPDLEIFRLAQSEYGNPEVSGVYYFDDKERNIQAAQEAVNWNTFVFKDANTVRQALAMTPQPL